MKVFLLLTAVIAVALGMPSHGVQPRIASGSVAEPGRFPFTVWFQKEKVDWWICGGAIINKNWILTDARCVTGEFTNYLKITYGYPKGNDKNRVTRIARKRVIKDALALLYVDEAVQFNENIKAARLASGDATDFADALSGKLSYIVGWGQTSDFGPVPDSQQHFSTQKILPRATCAAAWKNYPLNFDKDYLCSEKVTGLIGHQGDQGDPVAVQEADGSYTLAGIYVRGKGYRNLPMVHANIASYRQWIESTVASSP